MCNIYKKHTALLAMFMAITIGVIAQDTTRSMSSTSMATNSSTITAAPAVRSFPGRKAFRTWSIGINGGVMFPAVAFGGTNNFSNPEITIGYGANIKYQVTHWLAFQIDFLRGKLQGNQDHNLRNDITPAANPFPIYRNVKSFTTDLHSAISFNGVFTLGNINWLSARSKIIPYFSVGGGIATYETKIVSRVVNPGGGYTTSAEHPYSNSAISHFFLPVGLGLKFNLSKAINLDLGYRAHYMDADDLDGYSYFDTRNGPSDPGMALHKDKFSYAFVGLEFALGSKSKPQLMFDNPAARMNADLQNQIDVLRSQLNLADTDGDGVADIFDKEPNTPAGCPVDTHGVMRDTDGDGVPDCRDKELITPTYCQPVDANGVGKCPPPECCANLQRADSNSTACNVGDLPSVSFKGNANTLSADAKAILATVAAKLKASPNCGINVTGYPAASKASQAVCNRRTAAIVSYLTTQEGISSDRLSVNCQVGGGDANTVDLKVR